MSLKEYTRKRNFAKTPEPDHEKVSEQGPLRFVVQKHAASRLHYDLRIEWDGVFKSWAVPKGPSLNPTEQRLAVFVEDHPITYGSFEGIIPEKNYGAGTVLLWDAGTVIERKSHGRADSEEAFRQGFAAGHITFILNGQKLKGEFALIKIGKDDPKAWLLIKKRDRFARSKGDVLDAGQSVKSGRDLDAIAAEAQEQGSVWLPGKGPQCPVPSYPFAPVYEALDLRPEQAAPDPVARPSSSVSLADLPEESFPRKLGMMQAKRFREPFQQTGWLFAPDFGGLPVRIEKEGARLRIQTRGGLKKNFPKFTKTLSYLPAGIYDGEVVWKGYSTPQKGKEPDTLYLVDVLHLQGKDTRSLPAIQRHSLLQDALSPIDPTTNVTRKFWVEENGVEAFETFLADQAQGMLAIAANSVYQPGVQNSLLKILPIDEDEGIASILPPIRHSLTKHSPTLFDRALPELKNGQKIASGGPTLSHLEKLYWPEEGISKGDLVAYYQKIAPILLPYLQDRPLSLNRHPDGITGQSFFHKDMTGYFPSWFSTSPITSRSMGKTVNYAICQNEASLLYLANFGCIEINPWFSRLGSLDFPDFLVIDLDPDQTPFSEVLSVAYSFHTLLDELKLKHCIKTSGSTGIHICVPLAPQTTYDDSRHFTEDLCRVINTQHPDTTSTERNPSKRRRKMYLDALQNRRSQTLACVYSVRPKPNAPVSTPVTPEELRAGFQMEDFTIHTIGKRLEAVGDLWAPMLEPAASLEPAWQTLRDQYQNILKSEKHQL